MSLLSWFALFVINTSIYTLEFQDIDGNAQSMSQFQGKKILLVNIATESPRVNQLAGLQQLHQQYGDSVVIIGFPSNSFGAEPRTNAEIKAFCQTNYGVTFLLASKTEVAGTQSHPIFNWLANATENGVIAVPTQRNFQKFLIGKTGMLSGYFVPAVEPADSSVIESFTNNPDL
jgi:glutathione peroxidase